MESANSLPHFLQGPENYPADSVIAHFANRAKAGAGIVTCTGINDFNKDKHMPMDIDIMHFPDFDLYNPQAQNYLVQLADAIHYYGSIACMGFFMAESKYCLLKKDHPFDEGHLEYVKPFNPIGIGINSSNEEIKEFYEAAKKVVRDLDVETMEFIAESYAQQSAILKSLGFDMVSIHLCYRAQLPTKFLSPLTNDRSDEFGGSIENRARFALMILKKVREAVGKDFIIEILFSGEEEDMGGYTREEGAQFLKLFDPYVDIVQIRASEADPNHPIPFNLEETPFLEQAAFMKKSGVNMKIASVGGWHNPKTAEKALSEGKIDIVSMARAWISNPDYGKLIYEDRAEDIVPCLRCNKCHGRGKDDVLTSICSVNPKIGIEHRLHYMRSGECTPKKVAVVGGGPAGMKAAMDLFDRGHSVTLFEKEAVLGGAIKHSDFVDFKWTLKDFKDYLIAQVNKRNIEVVLNKQVTPKEIEEKGFDAVVVATGAVPVLPPIDGLSRENIIFATEALENKREVVGNVVVIGGGEVGVETGMHFAKEGHNVTVLEMRNELAADATMIHYRSMFQEAWESIPNFTGIVSAKVVKADGKEIFYVDKDGKEHSILADTVIVSAGMKSKLEDVKEFYGCTPHMYTIGDCVKPATVEQAMRTAYAVAGEV